MKVVTIDWLNELCGREGIERSTHEHGERKYFRMSRDGFHHYQMSRDKILAMPRAALIDMLKAALILRLDYREPA